MKQIPTIRRSKLEVIHDILSTIQALSNNESSIYTHILYQANLNNSLAKSMLDYLEHELYIYKLNSQYFLSAKGKDMLDKLNEVTKSLSGLHYFVVSSES